MFIFRLQIGSGDVTYSMVAGSVGANYFTVLGNSGIITVSSDLKSDTQDTANYTVSFTSRY
jgi:hypothetical protein